MCSQNIYQDRRPPQLDCWWMKRVLSFGLNVWCLGFASSRGTFHESLFWNKNPVVSSRSALWTTRGRLTIDCQPCCGAWSLIQRRRLSIRRGSCCLEIDPCFGIEGPQLKRLWTGRQRIWSLLILSSRASEAHASDVELWVPVWLKPW